MEKMRLVVGKSGKSRKIRSFSEKEFKEELIPHYVKLYYRYKNKETGEVSYCYVDEYGNGKKDEPTKIKRW